MKKAMIIILAIFVMANVLSLLPTIQAQSISQLVNPTFAPLMIIKDTTRYIGPAPCQQLATPSQPGHIHFNNSEVRPGDRINAFPSTNRVVIDSNGYIWQDQFPASKNAMVTKVTMVEGQKTIFFRLEGSDRELSTIVVIPQQFAVIYDPDQK